MTTTTPARVNNKEINCLVFLADLRAQKNYIFRLPPEILENVFTYGARDYYERTDYSFRVPCWVNVSYVCRHWRNVALNCPTLWTYHFTFSLRWTEELLARSKQASLKIYISQWNRRWSDFVEKVLDHAERIQELRLQVAVTALPAMLSLCTPRLQILDIDTCDGPSQQTFIIGNEDTLPLRTLKLNACRLLWHSTFNLSGVTTLFLRDIPSLSQLHITEFLATLSRMQALTVLHLERALPSARSHFLSSGTFGVSQEVGLPRLARLFVTERRSTVVVLLSCINIPLKTQLELEIYSEYISIDDYTEIPPALVQRFSQCEDPSSSSPAIRPLVIDFPFESTFTFGCGPANLSETYAPQDCDLFLRIWHDRIKGMNQIMREFCCTIPSTHIQTLHITSPPFSPDFWRKTFGHLDRLRYMRLSNGLMPDLVSLLSLPADRLVEAPGGDITDPTPGHRFVPALEELELCSIRFASEDELSEDAISKQSLLDALSTREALHLTMTRCRVLKLKETNRILHGIDGICTTCL